MVMSKWPPGWIETTIGEVTEYVSRGKTPKYINFSKLPVINQRAIRWFGIQTEHLKYIHPDQISQWGEERFIRDGDILWNSTGTGTIGRACLVKERDLHPPKVVDSHVTILRSNQRIIDPRYLFCWIRGPEIQNSIEDIATGTTNQIELNRRTIIRTHLPLPPLSEQKRIADKLERVLLRVDLCREHLDRVPILLNRFRKAVLTAAFSGELTEGWRDTNPIQADASKIAGTIHAAHKKAGGHKIGNAAPPTEDVHNLQVESFPSSWKLLTLRDVVLPNRPITYGILKPGPDLDDGVPYVRVADYRNEQLSFNGLRRTSTEIDLAFKRSKLIKGDILLSIRGTVGRLILVPSELDGANITQDSARISIQPALNRDFVLWYLRSEFAQSRMKSAVKGVAVQGINIGDIRALQIPVPSRREQNEIVHLIKSLFTYADRLEERFIAARAQVERLTPTILTKAFCGLLVPQDPNEEPANTLLEEIRSIRNSEETRPKQQNHSKKVVMQKTTIETISSSIQRLPTDRFTFNELRDHIPEDYDTLKDMVFALLSDPHSGLKQVFDAETGSMHFVRVKQ